MILESSPLTKRNYAIISLLIKYDLRQFYDFKISLQEALKNNFDASDHLSD